MRQHKRSTESRLRVLAIAGALAFLTTGPAGAQEVFRSIQSANLPTTETLRSGNWIFEVSHRFVPAIDDGAEALWGLDGPAISRIGMAWAPAEGALVGFQRTNLDDNLELYAKKRFIGGDLGGSPFAVAAMGGVAWNTDVVEIEGAEDNEMQAYAQLIGNVLLADGALALGVVPSWVHNPRLRDEEAFDAVALGIHGQWYFSGGMSLLAEWVFSEEKLIVTNQTRMHPTQYLAGSAAPFDLDQLRVGFNITRLLPF